MSRQPSARRPERVESAGASRRRLGSNARPRLDEITIGRDGALLHDDRDGRDYRPTIAELLDLEAIPVLVRRRHSRWQSIREDLSTATRRSELTDRARTHLEYPDICDPHSLEPPADGDAMPVSNE